MRVKSLLGYESVTDSVYPFAPLLTTAVLFSNGGPAMFMKGIGIFNLSTLGLATILGGSIFSLRL